MRRRTRIVMIVGAVILLAIGLLVALSHRPNHAGDTDGDGRYQHAEWSGAGEDGAPAILMLFAGTSEADCTDLEVRIEAPGEGGIGSFASTIPDAFEVFLEGITGESPVLTWNLSNYAAGTVFTVRTKYLDAKGRVLDEETITTTR